MKTRVLIWAGVGFSVAAFWAIYWLLSPPAPANPNLLMAAKLTQPFAYATLYLHFGLTFYWAIVANTITYGLIGLLVETMRRHKPAHIRNHNSYTPGSRTGGGGGPIAPARPSAES